MYFTSAEKGWIAGDGGYLASTSDGGKTWTKYSLNTTEAINEIYFRNTQPAPDFDEGRRRLRDKIALVAGDPALVDMRIADYGTRRRFSSVWHEEVVLTQKEKLGANFSGIQLGSDSGFCGAFMCGRRSAS